MYISNLLSRKFRRLKMKLRNLLKPIIQPTIGIDNEDTRELWLERTLAAIPKDSRILDAGAGTQRYAKFCKHLIYVSQDFGKYDGEGDASGLQMGDFDYGKLDIVSDITAIPEANLSFDAIMCVEVFEHIPDPIQAVKEFSRLLKPGGDLVITAPFCSLTHFSPYHFSTGFNKYWYEKHLLDHNFIISEITPNGNFFEFVAQELYRISSVSKQYAKSKPRLIEQLCIYILLRMLLRFSKRDDYSSELLCYGYHVLARKSNEIPEKSQVSE